MNYNQINNSPSAIRLLKAFDEFIKESSKKEYRFTIEEQRNLENLIKVLNNQINVLIEYEMKREVE